VVLLGFVHAFGFNTTVMVRSILLRGFDTQIANKIGDYMEKEGINFIRECVPYALEKIDDEKIKVKARYSDGTEYEDWFNTVVFAVGRDAETANIGLDAVGVKVNPSNGKIIHDKEERTNVDNIYAIGDVLDGKPELTPVAIQSGILLARRLCKVSTALTDYDRIPTTVFTPLEYGCCGDSEDDAIAKYGKDNVEIYHKNFWPLEWTVAHRPENACYAKLICLKTEDERVLGFHYLGPNAGEVTQGYAGMLVMGAKKADFDRLIGIHPTNAEWFTTMDITKASGVDPAASGC
jgi:thioredoxin reductase (NADPH)